VVDSGILYEVSLDHIEGVRVCPECLVNSKSIIHPPVDSDVFGLMVDCDRDSTQLHLKFNPFRVGFGLPYFDNSSLS